jgi:glycosyltransferase involved in cell wall biosynthesis
MRSLPEDERDFSKENIRFDQWVNPSIDMKIGIQDIPDNSVQFVCADLPYGQTEIDWDIRIDMNELWTEWWRVLKPNGVIALSKNTQEDIVSLGIERSKVRVIYGGGNVVAESQIQYARRDEMQNRLGIRGKYILCVGAIQPRKNIPFLLKAFAQWKASKPVSHQLVIAGPKENAAPDVLELIQSLGLEKDVLVTGYVADWELPLLYKGADIFVLPSRYEGFTLVTIEAMAYGTPVIASDTSSISEGTADAAVLVPLDDVETLHASLDRISSDTVFRSQLIAKGLERSALFTWDECAKQTLDVYQEIVSR